MGPTLLLAALRQDAAFVGAMATATLMGLAVLILLGAAFRPLLRRLARNSRSRYPSLVEDTPPKQIDSTTHNQR